MAYRIKRTAKNLIVAPFAVLIRGPVALLAYLLYKLATAADSTAEFIDYKVLPLTPGIEFENTNADAERAAAIDRLHG
jgi:hypothetical protein